MPEGPDNYFRQKAAQQKSSTLRDNYNHKADQMDDAFRDTSSSPLKFSGAQEDNMPPAPRPPTADYAKQYANDEANRLAGVSDEAVRDGAPHAAYQADVQAQGLREGVGLEGFAGHSDNPPLYHPQHLRADKHKSNIR